MTIRLTFILCLLGLSSVQAQDQSIPQPPAIWDPVPVDSMSGNVLWNDEKIRLDNVAKHYFSEGSDQVMYLIAYAARRACLGEAQRRALRAKNYLVDRRGLPSGRVIWIDGGHREEQWLEVRVFPGPIGTEYLASPTIDKSEVRLRNCKPKSKVLRKKGK